MKTPSSASKLENSSRAHGALGWGSAGCGVWGAGRVGQEGRELRAAEKEALGIETGKRIGLSLPSQGSLSSWPGGGGACL